MMKDNLIIGKSKRTLQDFYRIRRMLENYIRLETDIMENKENRKRTLTNMSKVSDKQEEDLECYVCMDRSIEIVLPCAVLSYPEVGRIP